MRRAAPLDETHLIRVSQAGYVRVALVYPHTYHVGMSSLGYQVVYHEFNRREDTVCERLFLSETRPQPRTLETGRLAGEFDLVAFSLSFELDYSRIPWVLEHSGIPVWSYLRTEADPLIIGGGIALTYNPEPIADFLDACVIGEAEGVFPALITAYSAYRQRLHARRQDLLAELAQIPGVYIPSLYDVCYHKSGLIEQMRPQPPAPSVILGGFTPDIDPLDTHSVILTPNTEFASAHLIEIARGCGRQCRFCIAAYAHRWPRYRSVESVLRCAEKAAGHTDRIGLVGSSVSDHPQIDVIAEKLVAQGFRISVASLRAETVRPPLLDALAASGQNTLTIAPEVATPHLQQAINKRIDLERIEYLFELALQRQIQGLRLYYLLGVPGETDEDARAIINMAGKLRELLIKYARIQGRSGRISLTLSPLVPKPHTPFQWIPMASAKSLNAKLRLLRREIGKLGGVTVASASARMARMEGVLSRGDRRLAPVLYQVGVLGMPWNQAMRDAGLDPAFYLDRVREMEELFPWSHLDLRVERPYLQLEHRRHLRGTTTSDCRVGLCHKCGAC